MDITQPNTAKTLIDKAKSLGKINIEEEFKLRGILANMELEYEAFKSNLWDIVTGK